MKKVFIILSIAIIGLLPSLAYAQVLVEAESFDNKGGWVVDHQFMDQMGSPYLMAHGMGVPVENASTKVIVPVAGVYKVFVRTYNWVSPWYKDGDGPGGFKVKIRGVELDNVVGTKGDSWMWQEAGTIDLSRNKVAKGPYLKGEGDLYKSQGVVVDMELVDMTGFNGRCDAILLTQDMDYVPPVDLGELYKLRKMLLDLPENPEMCGKFDLVVAGGGVAGCAAALTAARLGLKVALIDDRPVLGGANTAAIKVGVNGGISHNLYPALSRIVREISNIPAYDPSEKDNPYHNTKPPKKDRRFNVVEDLRMRIFTNEPNITLFMSTRVYDVVMKNASAKGRWLPGPYFNYDVKVDNNSIAALLARNVLTGKEYCISSDLFVDCTGDGCVGYLAGADYRMGREGYYETFEPSAPYISDNLKMGSTLLWNTKECDTLSTFPILPWAVQCNTNYYIDAKGSSWNWESGFERDPFAEGERIRDNNLRAIFGNWSYLKNNMPEKYGNRVLSSMNYLSGKRESRRLLGDVILSENDIVNKVDYPDKSFTTTWSMDLHYPDEENSRFFPKDEWLSWCSQPEIEPYHVPYRTLYSRNIRNLFMAGRCISVTHVALGTVRVQATTGMMGEVVGMAAKVCHDNNAEPRDVYEKYLAELQKLMEEGAPSTLK